LSIAAFSLSACLGDEPVADVDQIAQNEIQLSGSVGDGPIVGAAMIVATSDGVTLAEFESDTSGGYSVTLTVSDAQYPLFLSASNGIDLVTNQPPDFNLSGTAISRSGNAIANVNPFTTLAIEAARDLPGGLSAANLRSAEMIVVTAAGSGLSTLAGSGPYATPINETNIAEVVRSSEALSEIVRRTRDYLNGVGISAQGDLVLERIGSDLGDEVIDGRGGSRSDARTAALATVVIAQVLLESMSNELHVNGVDATTAMVAAMNQAVPGTPQPALDELTATDGMVELARIGVNAAFAVSNDPAIAELGNSITGLRAGMGPNFVRGSLPADYRQVLNDVLLMIANGDANTLEIVNDVARTGRDTITPSNRSPSISGTPATSVRVGAAYTFTPNANDPDSDTLTFSIINQPAWTTFDPATGQLDGTPASTDEGSFLDIVIEVSDGEFSVSLAPFSINVLEDNEPPIISGNGGANLEIGESYDFTPTASDPEGSSLTFSIVNQPSWTNFNTTTGNLSGTPGTNDAGNYSGIIIRVSDGSFTTSLNAFTISVAPPNRAPTISGTPVSQVTVGQSYSFRPTVSDPDGDTLTFSITNRPAWAAFSTTNGQLSGTPVSADIGSYPDIAIEVSDGEFTASLPPFSINVLEDNQPPVISGNGSASLEIGENYDFTPTSSDPEGDALTFSIVNQPSWTNFNTTTGNLSGTPGTNDAGNYSGIIIRVSDGQNTTSLGAFTISVASPNQAPTISGTPASQVIAGQSYSFTPTTSDPDGDTLTFTIAGQPSWASFSSSTGTLSGTPGAGDVRDYAGITITVSDGNLSGSLGPFSISVVAAATGSATLSWTAPTRNTDGSALTDLAGYWIYWGTTPGSRPNSVRIDNPGVTTYVIENLAPGDYEFVATSFNDGGVQSRLSDTASLVIQ
jgi:hypothetical protein